MSDKKIIFSAFVFFYTIFFSISSFNPTIAGWIRNGLILLFPILNFDILKKQLLEKEYLKINLLFFLWGLIVIYSGFENANLSYDYISHGDKSTIFARRGDHAIYYVINIWFFVLYFEGIYSKCQYLKFLRSLFYFLSAYVIASDINAIVYNSPNGSGYLVGNKFTVCYLNLYLAIIYYLLHPLLVGRPKKCFLLLLCLNLVIALKTQCSTMVIGSVLMYLFSIVFKPNIKVKLYEVKTLILSIVFFSIIFFFFTTAIINTPIMKYIIVDVLGEDMTLTGRLGIYAGVASLLEHIPLFGYGTGNSHLITMMNEIGPNAQNGLFNLIIEIGIVGVIVYMSILIIMIKKQSSSILSYPILCFIYVMIVLSSVEITFSMTFLALAILLLAKPQQIYVRQRKLIASN